MVLFALFPSPAESPPSHSLRGLTAGLPQQRASLSQPSLPPRWALTLRCQGSRNVLSALRKAVEVDFRDKDKHQSQGIYLFTGGIPDQDMVGRPCPGHPLRPYIFCWMDA